VYPIVSQRIRSVEPSKAPCPQEPRLSALGLQIPCFKG
jgi:hypothetical protein